MVKTGYISFITESGGGFDANGNVLAATKVFSVDVDCNLNTLTREYKFIVDGQYVNAKYSVYVDKSKVIACNEVRVKDNEGNDLGTYQIQSIEYLNLVKQVKIIL